jgi:hypothetical protein
VKWSLGTEVGVEGVPPAHVFTRRGQARFLTKGLQQAVLAEREKECVVAVELLAHGAVEQAHLLIRYGRKLGLPDGCGCGGASMPQRERAAREQGVADEAAARQIAHRKGSPLAVRPTYYGLRQRIEAIGVSCGSA